MRAELKALLRESSATTIYVTHDQIEALSMGDRIAVMHGGQIVQIDTPLDGLRPPGRRASSAASSATPPMNFLAAEVASNGGPPTCR